MCAKSQNVIEYAYTRDEEAVEWERLNTLNISMSMARAIIFILVDHLMVDIISKAD